MLDENEVARLHGRVDSLEEKVDVLWSRLDDEWEHRQKLRQLEQDIRDFRSECHAHMK